VIHFLRQLCVEFSCEVQWKSLLRDRGHTVWIIGVLPELGKSTGIGTLGSRSVHVLATGLKIRRTSWNERVDGTLVEHSNLRRRSILEVAS